MASKQSRYTVKIICEETPRDPGRIDLAMGMIISDDDDNPDAGFFELPGPIWRNIPTTPLLPSGASAPEWLREKAFRRFRRWLPAGTSPATLSTIVLSGQTYKDIYQLERAGWLFIGDSTKLGKWQNRFLPRKSRPN